MGKDIGAVIRKYDRIFWQMDGDILTMVRDVAETILAERKEMARCVISPHEILMKDREDKQEVVAIQRKYDPKFVRIPDKDRVDEKQWIMDWTEPLLDALYNERMEMARYRRSVDWRAMPSFLKEYDQWIEHMDYNEHSKVMTMPELLLYDRRGLAANHYGIIRGMKIGKGEEIAKFPELEESRQFYDQRLEEIDEQTRQLDLMQLFRRGRCEEEAYSRGVLGGIIYGKGWNDHFQEIWKGMMPNAGHLVHKEDWPMPPSGEEADFNTINDMVRDYRENNDTILHLCLNYLHRWGEMRELVPVMGASQTKMEFHPG
ncbi:MAG: hypothetical protein KJ709_08475 [Nanoarchaeota archaeon]|nr:hypothetical protein [Nanoarchaeota archaeon]